MSRRRTHGTAGCRTRRPILFAAMAGALAATTGFFPARAAVADLLPDEVTESASALEPAGQRKADALAWFMAGLFEEESEGPEKALESKRKSLSLDPANTRLAIELSYDYLRRGDTAEAISVLKDAVKAVPGDMACCLALSSIYLRQLQKPEMAVKYAQIALEASPKAFPPYGVLSEIYQLQGQTTKAQQVLEKAAKSKSEDPRFWLALAEAVNREAFRSDGAWSEQDVQRLSALLGKAVSLAPEDPEILSKAGDLFSLARQIEKALPLYQKLVEVKPSYPLAREKLAACYVETGRNEDAIAMLNEVIKFSPMNLAAYDQLKDLNFKAGQIEKALTNARQALIMEPTRLERYGEVAGMLFDLRQYDAAADQLLEARKRFPRASRLSFLHARALSEAKRHDEAMKVFETALVEAANSDPGLLNADFYFFYGAAAERAGQYVKAAELFRKCIELDPADAGRAYNYLGYMWTEQNTNLEEAGQLIRRALELEPGNGAYIDSLGWLYYKQGKYQEALTELMRAAEAIEEPDAVVFDHIADTYDKLGKKAEAVLYWQKSLQLDPESKTVAAKLDQAAKKVVQQPKSSQPAP
jgi:tetratricopeptide (TPR) repeat protein